MGQKSRHVMELCNFIYSFSLFISGASTGSLCELKWSQTGAKYSLSLNAIF